LKTKEIYLKDIKQGDKVASTFLAAEKNMAFSLKGSPYLNVRLKDKTGELDGKVWDNAIQLDQQFKKGDIIYIEGKAANYKNSIQISIVKIIKNAWEDVEPADYLPAAKGDVAIMFKKFRSNRCKICCKLSSMIKKPRIFSREHLRQKVFIISI
jgi:3'-5' exoribonuclease